VKVVALLAPGAVAVVEEVAAVGAEVERIQAAIVVSLVEGKPEALRLCVVLQHKAAALAVGEDAVVAVEVHSLDIEVLALAEELLEEDLALEDLAYVEEDRVRGVGEVDHYEDCRLLDLACTHTHWEELGAGAVAPGWN
jgi:hypothetical protein